MTEPSESTLISVENSTEVAVDHERRSCLQDGLKAGDIASDVQNEEQTKQLAVIRSALDQQTQLLYEQYALEQHPNDAEQRKTLVADMQEQNFHRYMSETHQDQLMHQRQQLEQLAAMYNQAGDALASEGEHSDADVTQELIPRPLIPATLWTKKDLADFKKEILRALPKCCIKISSLSTATIRVPTHPDASSIYWEFATDNYDLGFGLYFEWDLDPPNTVSVTISESSDEEDEEDEEEAAPEARPAEDSEAKLTGDNGFADVESGRRRSEPRLPTDELIPVYRRDCHTEVYCGSHTYPGVGVYVFKFDNSFSLWRSKWLYYRIGFTK